MYAINKFARCTWEYIATLGKVINIEARDSHYVEVEYENLSTLGKAHFLNNKETVLDNGIVLLAGFSVSYNSTDPTEIVMRKSLLATSNTIKHISKMPKMDLYHLRGVMQCLPNEVKYDPERGSYAITDDMVTYVFYGIDEGIGWADTLLATSEEYHKRISINRTLWYKWLKEAEFISHVTGDLFKFPNGLSVKFDNKEEQLAATGKRMFCEAYDHNKEIHRFYDEEDFLVWLTRYF